MFDFRAGLRSSDAKIFAAIESERHRQNHGLELIASENFVSQAVLEALGSVMTNKYAEGYPGKRYYGGCQFVDVAEELAIERAKALFGADYVNVQPHSGSQANMAVYFSACKPGDTVLAMNLAHGGHLTHGHSVNFSGKLYKIVHYGVSQQDYRIDMNEVESLAKQHRPRMIIAGTSGYSRQLDYQAFRQIADQVGALLMADMAHPAGLIAAKLHPNPVPLCDFVTTTTHKTLRGPRGGMILCRDSEFVKALRSNVFPGIQGGPLMHVIAAKAVAFQEALQDDFVDYAQQVIRNTQTLANALMENGWSIVTGGTDTHLFLVDLRQAPITGQEAEDALSRVEMTVNKNGVPFDTRPPMVTSGIRLGCAALTTRGMRESEMRQIGSWISQVLAKPTDTSLANKIRQEVQALCQKFKLYEA